MLLSSAITASVRSRYRLAASRIEPPADASVRAPAARFLGIVGDQQLPLDRGGVFKINLHGLPLPISAMPKFLEAPLVIRFDQAGGIAAAVDGAYVLSVVV